MHVRPGRFLEQRAQREELLGGTDADPAVRKQFGGQARIEVGEPPPFGEHPDVVGEGLLLADVRAVPLPAPQGWFVRLDERSVPALKLVQVPPAADLGRWIAERQVVGVEQVGVSVAGRTISPPKPDKAALAESMQKAKTLAPKYRTELLGP